MKIWFLILVLTHPAKPNVEIHTSIGMESGPLCEQLAREAFLYGVYIDTREAGTYRTPLVVEQATCEERRISP